MDKLVHAAFNGAFNLLKAPLFLFLMLCIVISLVRHQQQRQRFVPVRRAARMR